MLYQRSIRVRRGQRQSSQHFGQHSFEYLCILHPAFRLRYTPLRHHRRNHSHSGTLETLRKTGIRPENNIQADKLLDRGPNHLKATNLSATQNPFFAQGNTQRRLRLTHHPPTSLIAKSSYLHIPVAPCPIRTVARSRCHLLHMFDLLMFPPA